MQSPEFQNALGQLVLSAAHIEYNLRSALIVLCSNARLSNQVTLMPGCDNELLLAEQLKINNARLAKALIPSNLQMNAKIELLRRVVKTSCTGKVLNDWEELAAEIEVLSKERNSYIHSMYGVDENKLIRLELHKGKKGKRDYFSEEDVSIDEIHNLVNRLDERNRQLVDFIEDFPYDISESNRKVPQSQNKHPRLKI